VLNQPLGNTTPMASSGGSKKGLSVGFDVLIGLLSFLGLCVILFGLRWVLARRKYRTQVPSRDDGELQSKDAYALAALRPEGDAYGPSEDALRMLRYEAYKRNRRMRSQYSTDSSLTKVGEQDGAKDDLKDVEMGIRPSFHDPWDPHTSLAGDWRDTLVGDEGAGGHKKNFSGDSLGSRSPPTHRRNLSDGSNGDTPVTAPLLAHVRTPSQGSDGNDMDLGDGARMTGIGTANRRSLRERDSVGSIGSMQELEGTSSRPYAPSPLRPRAPHILSNSSTLRDPPAEQSS